METVGEDKRIWETTALKGRAEGRGSKRDIKNVSIHKGKRKECKLFKPVSLSET